MNPPPIDISPANWEIVKTILQGRIPEHEVWAFGSRVMGTARQYSDLDLAVMSDRSLPFDVRAALVEEFEESDLPFKVDVVDWATTKERFRSIIEKDHVVVHKPVPEKAD
jgi:predicted nucleotidyltransferase